MASRKRNIITPFMSSDSKEDLDSLLVFGYECKIFRDDEKAAFIDEGRHLIPWMGDPSLLIDRYDGRGHLYDLKPYDAASLSGESKQLSEEDIQIERLIDEERYMELHTDLMERAMYEEEEMKRLSEALQDNSYGAVGFSYEPEYDPSQPTETKLNEEEEEEEEEAFEPHSDLYIPSEMVLPKTVKLNAIIEKTAKFISEHGMQMEIVIKTKQADNPQFEFLHFEHELNAYYKHLVQMIKSGRYRPKVEKEKRKRSLSSEASDGEHSYLHPSLVKTTESVQISPPENFLKLVRSKLPSGQITNTPYARLVSNIGKHTEVTRSLAPVVKQTVSTAGNVPPPPLPPGLGITVSQPRVAPQTTRVAKAYETGSGRNHSNRTHQQQQQQPPIPGVEPVTLPYQQGEMSNPQPSQHHARLLPSDTAHQPQIVPPPPEKRLIVDRMAMYVAKNGADFETVVKSKDDTRFDFVQSWHEHYPYYEYMRQHYEKEYSALRYEKSSEDRSSPGLDDFNRASSGKAVTFTIKTRDSDTPTLGSSAAFHYESSEDEKEGEEKRKDDFQIVHTRVVSEDLPSVTPAIEKPEKVEKPQVPVTVLEQKQAKEKIKDRLALAARDKLAQSSKEKQLKAERKRKAAMFVNMLKKKGGSDAEKNASSAVVEPQPQPQPQPLPQLQPQPQPTPSDVNTRVASSGSATSAIRSHPQERSKLPASSTSSQRRPRSPSLFYKKRRPRSPLRPRSRSRSRSPSPYSRKRKSKSRTQPSAFVDSRRSSVKKRSTSIFRVQTSEDDPIRIDDD